MGVIFDRIFPIKSLPHARAPKEKKKRKKNSAAAGN